MTIFTHTGGDQMIEGAKFIGGVFHCYDPIKEASLRKSKLFGKTLFVLEPPKEEVIPEPVKAEEVIPEVKPEPVNTDEQEFAILKEQGWKHLDPVQKERYQVLKAKLEPNKE
jgi:hypothetical protein